MLRPNFPTLNRELEAAQHLQLRCLIIDGPSDETRPLNLFSAARRTSWRFRKSFTARTKIGTNLIDNHGPPLTLKVGSSKVGMKPKIKSFALHGFYTDIAWFRTPLQSNEVWCARLVHLLFWRTHFRPSSQKGSLGSFADVLVTTLAN